MTKEGYIIDGGGGDIRVEMSQMNFLDAMSFKPLELRNGAIADYHFVIDSFVYLDDADILLIDLPPQVLPNSDITCQVIQPDPVGVLDVDCSANE